MLAELFRVTLIAGCAAAVVLWVLAVRVAGGVVAASGGSLAGWVLAVLWPFGARQTAGVSAEKSTSLNKMLVGFFIAILVAIASMAVYSNLTFVPPTR